MRMTIRATNTGLLANLPLGVFSLASLAVLNALGQASNPFLSIYLTQQLSMRADDVGLTLSLRGVAAVAGAYCVGFWLRISGPRLSIVGSFLFASSMLTFIAFSRMTVTVTILLMLIAVARDLFRPVYNVHLAAICQEEDRGRAYSIFIMATNAGGGVAALIGASVFAYRPINVFYWDAGIGVLAAVTSYLLIKPSYPKSVQSADLSPSVAQGKYSRSFLLICGIYFSVEMAESISFFVIPLRLRDKLQLDPYFWGGLIASMNVAVFSLSLVASTYVKRHDQRIVATIAGIFMCLGLMLVNLANSQVFIAASWILFCLGQIFVYPALMQQVLASRSNHTSAYVAFYYSWSSVAAVTGPLIAGVVYDKFADSYVWVLCAIFAATCGCIGSLLIAARSEI